MSESKRIDKVGEKIKDLLSEIEGLMKDIINGTKEKAATDGAEMARKISEKMSEVNASVSERYSCAKEKTSAGYKKVETLVKENPGKSVAIAGSIGAVLAVGLLLSRKKK